MMAPHNTNTSSEKNHGSDSESKKTSPKCPRCDSPDTKFCYYNNYSLTQPRHFCKTCRRYWTNGGALRNVPIGGGCRKKKAKTSSSSLSTPLLSRLSCETLLQGLNPPSLDFQFGGLPIHNQLSLTNGFYNQLSSIGDVVANTKNSSFQLDPSSSSSLMGLKLNYPFSSSNGSGFNGGAIHGTNSLNLNSTLASSIESLSSINQDLHLKLQQQRFATMFGGENQKDSSSSGVSQPQVQPMLFQNLEISKPEMFEGRNSGKEGPNGDALPTDWFFGNSYYSSMASTTTNGGSVVGIDHGNANSNCNIGVHAWGDLEQPYSPVLP